MQRLMDRTLTTALGLLVLLSAAPASAGVPSDQLKASIDQVIKLLEDPALKASEPQRRAAMRQVADQIFDFNEAARRALGRHWQKLSEQDRKEFTGLFADLLERSYTTKIEQYSGEAITFLGETVEGDGAVVKTKFVTKKGTEIPVDYRMLRRGERWQVYDVSVEGLSLIANYRGQFNKIIETSSYQDLVKRMKARTEEFQAPAAGGKKKDS